MKIIAINGSPRREGNTVRLIDAFLRSAQAAGAETEEFVIEKLRVHPCIACAVCKNNRNRCAINDDMQQIYEEIQAADGIFFAFPIYMGQMTAQAKTFVDRLYAFFNRDFSTSLKPGKKLILGITQGESDPDAYAGYLQSTREMLGFVGFTVTETLVAAGLRDTADILQKGKETLARAESLGKELARG